MDDLYFHNDIREVFAAVASFPFVYNLSKKETYDKVLADIKNGTAGNIQQDLYNAYSENLRKAVSGVFPSGDNADRFSANVNRFAAYKSYQATQKLIQQFADNPESFDKIGKAILNTYNRYQAAEYNTAIARCRTAKQWDSFMQDDNKFLFPNMRWLKSTSAEPREAHRIFWGKVWAKTDPFWNDNQPGNLWNCKCDWEETADPVTDNASVYQYMKKHGTPVQKGLNGNPAKTGELFTDECAYVKRAGNNRKERDSVEVKCETINKQQTVKIAKESLIDKKTECTINGQKCEVEFIGRGIHHYARDIFGEKNIFWIKNEILPKIQEYIKNAKCVGRKVSDTGHNTNKETLKLKEQTDYFYYFTITLPNGKEVCLHLGRYNGKKEGKEGKLYLYTVTKKAPKEMEEI